MIADVMLAAHSLIEHLPMAEQQERLDVVQEALTWVGTPYHHQGRVRGAGVDCGMLLLEVFEATGLLPHVNPEPYPHDWHLHRSAERYLGVVMDWCQRVDEPLPGDLALFRFGRCTSHGAIVLGGGLLCHSYVGKGVVLDDLAVNQELGTRLVGYWSRWGAR